MTDILFLELSPDEQLVDTCLSYFWKIYKNEDRQFPPFLRHTLALTDEHKLSCYILLPLY